MTGKEGSGAPGKDTELCGRAGRKDNRAPEDDTRGGI